MQILVVEDDPNVVELVEVTLSGDEYEIIAAGDGVAGLEQLRHHLPDLVVLDIMIPQLDGYEFIRQAKADQRTADVPIVVLSVRSLEEDITHALRLSAEQYLTKSQGVERGLAHVVQEVLHDDQ